MQADGSRAIAELGNPKGLIGRWLAEGYPVGAPVFVLLCTSVCVSLSL